MIELATVFLTICFIVGVLVFVSVFLH